MSRTYYYHLLLIQKPFAYSPDEDGKTALDKARERNDEGHREVANLLQSPAEWMSGLSDSESGGSSYPSKEQAARKKKAKEPADSTQATTTASDEALDPTIMALNEPELVYDYIKKLLPIFCHTYQSSMIRQVKKSGLSLIRKIVVYMNREQLVDLNKTSTCVQQIVEVISNCCLDAEEDEECCMFALQMVQDLLDKEFNLFLDHFARLGVFNKVQSIAGISELNNNGAAATAKDSEINKSIYSNKTADGDELTGSQFGEDCKEMLVGRPYHWRDWNIVRSKDCLYLWSDSVILELSNGESESESLF